MEFFATQPWPTDDAHFADASAALQLPPAFSRACAPRAVPPGHGAVEGESRTRSAFFFDTHIPLKTSISQSHFPRFEIAYTRDAPMPDSVGVKAFHSSVVADASSHWAESPPADGMVFAAAIDSIGQERRFHIRTADCLAVVFAAVVADKVFAAIVHAGWRGYVGGIHFAALRMLEDKARAWDIASTDLRGRLSAHIAPAIFGCTYPCGREVEHALLQHRQERLLPLPGWEALDAAYLACIDVARNGVALDTRLGRFSLEDHKIHPDLQALMACDLLALGLDPAHVRVHRENTFGHAHLPSFRAGSLGLGDPRARLHTHLVVTPAPR